MTDPRIATLRHGLDHYEFGRDRDAEDAALVSLADELAELRRVPPFVRQVLERAMRLDMTQPPVTNSELRMAVGLLPGSPSFRGSVDGMEALAAAERRAEAAEAELTELRRQRDEWAERVGVVRELRERDLAERDATRGVWRARAEAAEARLGEAQTELAAPREALEEIASTDFDEPSDFSELGRIARAALARAAQPDGRHRGSCRVFYEESVCTCGADGGQATPVEAIRRLLDAYHGDKPESVEVATAAQKVEAWLLKADGGQDG